MADAPENISEAIEQNAMGPRRVQIDSESVEQHPIKDQIEAENHLAANEAGKQPHFGIRFSKITPRYT